MRSIDALARLADLRLRVFTTNDAAAALRITRAHASKTMARLAAAKQVVRLRRGSWGFPNHLDPLALPALLAAPAPCYVSLQSALYLHGLISQVPQRIYAVSSGRTRELRTPLGTVSIHHVKAGYCRGFDLNARTGVAMATPEKALVDFLYLGPARSRLFTALPELRLPRGFQRARALTYAALIASSRRRARVLKKLDQMLRAGRRRVPGARQMAFMPPRLISRTRD